MELAWKHPAMLRRLAVPSSDDLERQLLRRSVGTLASGRHCCEDCGRSPLVGERVFRYGRGVVVCALCRPGRPGEPEATAVVRHPERGQAVRVRPRLAL